MLTTISTNPTPSSKDVNMQRYAQIISQIPPHLRQYIVEQDYSRYTPVDQATWRFSLRQLKSYLSTHAHPCYVDGLAKTGITVDSIPHINLMCEKLQSFGWTAVPVSGFIPPAAFMELQSLSFLPIACDMRSIDHILYTPAPDIVHEAAGHAPILIDPQFAAYLKEYAQVAKKAIISSEDLAQYEAIRDLSDIKENPDSTAEQIAAAEKHLQDVNAAISHVSEAALLGRMNWWTAEYGLIGELDSPQIFGAGLLSSVGEARHCLSDKVKKVPLTVDCVQTSYDITEKQPQLFVARTFADLSRVLHQMEETLSFKKGGKHGLLTAQKAATVNTLVLNSGLQISGKLTHVETLPSGEVYYYKFTGPVQLSENEAQLEGHGKEYHADGFSSPLGLLKDVDQCLADMNEVEAKQIGLIVGQKTSLKFASGIVVSGQVSALTFSKNNKLLLASFKDCTVSHGSTPLFKPEWGTFDMAVGSIVTSVFGGPADRAHYGLVDSFVNKVIPRKIYSENELLKHSLYQDLRDMRDKKKSPSADNLEATLQALQFRFPNEWLAFIEVLELSYAVPELARFQESCKKQLMAIQSNSPKVADYIQLGLEIASEQL
jgi:phenylalanine-4-hydroxylase